MGKRYVVYAEEDLDNMHDKNFSKVKGTFKTIEKAKKLVDKLLTKHCRCFYEGWSIASIENINKDTNNIMTISAGFFNIDDCRLCKEQYEDER